MYYLDALPIKRNRDTDNIFIKIFKHSSVSNIDASQSQIVNSKAFNWDNIVYGMIELQERDRVYSRFESFFHTKNSMSRLATK